MESKKTFLILVAIWLLTTPGLAQEPLGTGFTYQGRLQQSGDPAAGSFDLRFTLHDAATPDGDSALGTLTRCAVEIAEGLFTVPLDFGNVFQGEELWLETEVAPAGPCDASTVYTPLSPLQPVGASPNALYASDAGTLEGRTAGDFLPSDTPLEQLELSGDLVLSGDGGRIVFGDGTTQDTASGATPPTVTTPSVFVPAAVRCGGAPESDPLVWGSLASGTFRLTLDGTSRDVAVNFAGVAATMPAVAERVQQALRGATGGQERVVWLGDRFELRSADTTSTSSIAPLEPTGIPIDISGAGGDNWLDCDAGNATVIDAVLDTGAYSGHVTVLGPNSQIDRFFVPDSQADVAPSVSRFLNRNDDGPGDYLIEIPMAFPSPNRFEIAGTMTLFFDPQGTGDNWDSALRFYVKGTFGSESLYFFNRVIDNRDPPPSALSQVAFDWPFTQQSTSSSVLSLDVLNSRVAARIVSIQPLENTLRIAVSITQGNLNVADRWNVSLQLQAIRLER